VRSLSHRVRLEEREARDETRDSAQEAQRPDPQTWGLCRYGTLFTGYTWGSVV
jgi:hypothetical protein